MKVINGLASHTRQPTPVILTIGNFDGLHVGHRALVSQVIESARKTGALSTVISFDPHPTQVLRPESPSPRLFSVNDLIEQLRQMNLDQIVIEPFTRELSKFSAQDFIKYLTDHLLITKLCVGHDFKFGHDREGSSSKLKELAEKFGFELSEVAPFALQNEIVSSSLIRKSLTSGDVELAARFLARPYYVEGEVVSGDGRGQQLGFATANLACVSEIVPASGVYITSFEVHGQKMNSISNLGYKPTFHANGPLTIETHVLDQNEQFVGQKVRVEFLKRLRSEIKFTSPQALIEQIRSDIAQTRKFFEGKT
jgi:riboflavin kinase / FMN adenylyltransferase